MAKREVIYAMFGSDSYARSVEVKVENDATVLDLKKEIKCMRGSRIGCDADELELYLAKKRCGAWMTMKDVTRLKDTKRLTLLRDDTLVNEYDVMETYSDDEDGEDGEDDDDGDDDEDSDEEDEETVRVVVVVPSPLHVSADCVLPIARLGASHSDLIIKKLGLRVEFASVEEPEYESMSPFQFEIVDANGSTHPPTVQSFIEDLRSNIPLNSEQLQWLDVSCDQTVLATKDERLPFGLRGTATLLLVDRRSIIHNEPLAGVRMVVQVEEVVSRRDRPQALAQLVAASLKAPLGCTPISLLTNLRDCWFFSWFDANKVLMHVSLKYPKNAFEFIKAATASTDSKTPFSVPYTDRVFTKDRLDELFALKEEGCSCWCEC